MQRLFFRHHSISLSAWLFVLGAALFATGALADPPTRVARMAYSEGPVSFSPAGDDQWVGAIVNRPLITGDRLWVDSGARAEIALDNGAFWLGAGTSATIANLDDRTTQIQLTQGAVDLRVRQLQPGGVFEIDTPNLAFVVTRPGHYRVDVDPQNVTTAVAVRSGAADVYGEGTSYAIVAGQTYRFTGNDLNNYELVDARPYDDFDRWADGRGRRFEGAAAQYVSPEVIGYEDLDSYGSWRPDPSYGNVWYPREVPTGWAPYRYGHWAWIDPWGWTWVDDAPWGFAPFHYGRWAFVGGAWGWVPGPVRVRPVYAPALVAFVGGSNFAISVSTGPAIGWFPLGPGEVYRPAYNVSRNYFTQVNVSNTVINNTYITNVYENRNPGPVRYANMQVANAVTAVPPAAFSQSRPVNRVALPVSAPVVNRLEFQTTPNVVPSRQAFTGAAPAATSKPATAVVDRQVVARTAPPPPPVPVSQQLQLLQRNQGKPLEAAQIQAVRPASTTAPNVRLIGTPASPTNVAPATQQPRTPTNVAPANVAPPASRPTIAAPPATVTPQPPPRAAAPAEQRIVTTPPVTNVPSSNTPQHTESRVISSPPATVNVPPRSVGSATPQTQMRTETPRAPVTTPPTSVTPAPNASSPGMEFRRGEPQRSVTAAPPANVAPNTGSPGLEFRQPPRSVTAAPQTPPPPPQAQRMERPQAVPPAAPPPAAVTRSAPPGQVKVEQPKHDEKKEKDTEKER